MLTILNQYKNRETQKVETKRTVLSGSRRNGFPSFHWEANTTTSVGTSGLNPADSVFVMLWFDVNAEGKEYRKPKEFAALSPADVDKYWTLAPQDRIVKGEVTDGLKLSEIADQYDDVITVTGVETVDYGVSMPGHWEVIGR